MSKYRLEVQFGYGLSKTYEFDDLVVAVERFERKSDLLIGSNVQLVDTETETIIRTNEVQS